MPLSETKNGDRFLPICTDFFLSNLATTFDRGSNPCPTALERCDHSNLINSIKKQPVIMMNREQKIQQSETRIFKAVFPDTTNHYDTLFGGHGYGTDG
jgi:hypothetical protein